MVYGIEANRYLSSSDCTLADSTGKTLFYIRDGSGNAFSRYITTNIYDGLWHHIAWSLVNATSNQMIVHVDGIAQTLSGSCSGSPSNFVNFDQSVYVGAANNRGTTEGWIEGVIDELKIFNYPLTAGEILTEYNRGAALVLGAGKSETNPINSLVGWWKLDESTGYTAFDSSGKNNTGILTNGPLWKQGKIGKAVNFDGSNDNIVINNEANFDFERTDKFSIAAWVNLSSSFGSNLGSSIFTKSLATRGYEFWISPQARNVVVELYNTFSSNHLKVTSTNTHTIKYDTWHHVAFTYDGSSSPSGIAIYVDGVSQATTTSINNLTATILNDYSPKIATWDSTFGYFGGSIDNVKVWNNQLSAAEMAWEYNQGAPIYHWDFNEGQGIITGNAQAKSVTTDGLVGFWTLDSTTVNDYSGNGNNLTNSGSPTAVTGMKGNAVDYLASSTQYSYCTDANCGADLDYQGNGITVSTWVKADSDPGANMTIVSKDYYTSSTDNGGYVLYWADSTSQYSFAARNSSGTANGCVAASGVNIDTTYWQHVVGTYDGINCKIYVNGVLKDTEAYTVGIKNVTQDFTIGRHDAGSYWDGKIDHVKVWQRTLSSTEIATEYGYDEKYGYLTNMDAATDWVEGAWPNLNRPKLGKALDFDGTNDYVSFGSNISINGSGLTYNNFSLSLWIRPTGSTSGVAILNKANEINIKTDTTNGGQLTAAIYYSSSWHSIYSSFVPPQNQWTHIALIYNGSSLSLYANNNLITSDNYSDNITSTTDPFLLANAYITASNFAGQIDEFKIYNYALRADQIKLDYNNSTAVRF